MSDEKEIVEDASVKSKQRNIWKDIFIITITLVLSCFALWTFINSDWFVNKTMPIKKQDNVELCSKNKNIKWSYESKYESGQLKVKLTLCGIDEKMMDYIRNNLSDSDYLVNLHFVDDAGYKVAELPFTTDEFIHCEKGTYSAQGVLNIDKKVLRKVTNIEPIYRECLLKKYSDLMREIQNAYRRTMNNLFNYW